jgi:hypothetical protein
MWLARLDVETTFEVKISILVETVSMSVMCLIGS